MPTTQPTKPPQAKPSASERKARLEERTREELFELARQLEIPGHAEMSKAELIEAIRRR
jgi:hypothetical protein